MSIEDEARKQADQIADRVFEEWNPFSNTVDAWTDGFVEGYMIALERQSSDAEVEAVARVFYASQTGADMLATSVYRDKWMGIARAALIAALSARNTRETNG